LFGTLGYVTRQAQVAGLDALPFVAWRGVAATLGVLVLLGIVGSRAGATGRVPDVRLLPANRRWALVAASLCGALLNVAIFIAFVRMSVAVALICFYTFPAVVTVAAVRLYGERLDKIRATALVVSMTGLALVVLAPALSAGDVVIDPLGVLLALIGGALQASFVLITGRGFAPLAPLHVAVYVVFAALVVSAPLAVLAGQGEGLLVPLRDGNTWVWILAGGVLGAAIPTTLFVTGINLIGPSRAAILMTIEPLVGVILAVALLGEHPLVLQVIGGGMVLAAAAVLQMAPRRSAEVEAEIRPLV
jgi:drug/metabolite transporter (DMT)-like permease